MKLENLKKFLTTIQSYTDRWVRFTVILYDHFINDGCMTRAAALTYTSLLSLVPLMTVGFAIFAAFPGFNELREQIQSFIFTNFVATSGEVVQTYLQHFVAQTGNLSVIGAFSLIVAAVLMIFNMEQAFNAIWHVTQHRKIISTFLLYWAVLTLSPILLGLSIVISTYVISLPIITQTAMNLGLQKWLLSVFPFMLSTTAFTLLYVAVPNCRVPIRYGFIGAVVAAILFEIAKNGFAYYVTRFPTYTLLYGALATIPVFLLWLYTVWLIILFGAVLSYVLTVGYPYRSTKKMEGFTQAFRWLGHLRQAQQLGQSLTVHELIALDNCSYEIRPDEQIELMVRAKLIQTTENNRYVLSKDLSSLTLGELLRLLPWRLPTVDELKQWPGDWERNLQKIIEELQPAFYEKLNIPMKQLYISQAQIFQSPN